MRAAVLHHQVSRNHRGYDAGGFPWPTQSVSPLGHQRSLSLDGLPRLLNILT
jgi:hypothetical protein